MNVLPLNDVNGTFINEYVNSYATIKYSAFIKVNIESFFRILINKMICKENKLARSCVTVSVRPKKKQ